MKKFLILLMFILPFNMKMFCQTLVEGENSIVRCEGKTKICYVYKLNGQSIIKCTKKMDESNINTEKDVKE